MNNMCPCGSNKDSEQCCLKFINGTSIPSTAEELMRSRYTAFYFNNEDYIIKTWHKKKRLSTNSLSSGNITWKNLEIINHQKGQLKDSKGTVEFKATYIENGQEKTIHEISKFIKNNMLWFYVNGTHIK